MERLNSFFRVKKGGVPTEVIEKTKGRRDKNQRARVEGYFGIFGGTRDGAGSTMGSS